MKLKSGFKSKQDKVLPVRAVCRNCGTSTVGRYCHACGQDLFAGTNHRLYEIVNDTLGTLFALDGKVFRTLWYLVAFPGRLTKEFYAGRIVRYVYPSKLFWFITIIFFALLWSQADFGDDAAVTIRNLGQKEMAGNGELSTKEEMRDYFTAMSPYIVLMLVPVFALLVWGFWPRRERTYSDYLVFSFHINSFIYLLFSTGLVVVKIFPDFDGGGWFLFWCPLVYFAIALWKVYRPRIIPMILKIWLFGLAYLILMAGILALILTVFVYLKKEVI